MRALSIACPNEGEDPTSTLEYVEKADAIAFSGTITGTKILTVRNPDEPLGMEGEVEATFEIHDVFKATESFSAEAREITVIGHKDMWADEDSTGYFDVGEKYIVIARQDGEKYYLYRTAYYCGNNSIVRVAKEPDLEAKMQEATAYIEPIVLEPLPKFSAFQMYVDSVLEAVWEVGRKYFLMVREAFES